MTNKLIAAFIFACCVLVFAMAFMLMDSMQKAW